MKYKLVNESSREMPVEIFEIISMEYGSREMIEKINKECDDYNLKITEIDLNNEDGEMKIVIGDRNMPSHSKMLNG